MLQSLVGAAFSTLGSGGLSRLKQLDGGAVTASGESLEDLFHKYDADESGTVDKAELTAMMHELGHDVSGEELDALIRKVDKDGSGELNIEEFSQLVTAADSAGATAAQLDKVQARLAALMESGETLGGPGDLERVLRENPELMDDIKLMVSTYIESTVMEMTIPNINGDKDWGRYSIHGLAMKAVSLPPQGLHLDAGTGVRIAAKGVTAELNDFVWHYAKTKGFPKLKDEGEASAGLRGLDIDVSFELAADGSGGLSMTKLEGHVHLAELEVAVGSGGRAASWLYNKLLKAFSEQIKTAIEHQMQRSMERALIDIQVRLAPSPFQPSACLAAEMLPSRDWFAHPRELRAASRPGASFAAQEGSFGFVLTLCPLLVQAKVGTIVAMLSGGTSAAAAAEEQKPIKWLCLVKCSCQTGIAPHSPPRGVLAAGSVVEILEEQVTAAGIERFRTVAGWSNKLEYSGKPNPKGYSASNPREGTPVLRQLSEEELPLAMAKSTVDRQSFESKIWAYYLEQLPKKEQKQALKEQKKAASAGKRGGANHAMPRATHAVPAVHAEQVAGYVPLVSKECGFCHLAGPAVKMPYHRRMAAAVSMLQDEACEGRWQFSEPELLLLSVARLIEGTKKGGAWCSVQYGD